MQIETPEYSPFAVSIQSRERLMMTDIENLKPIMEASIAWGVTREVLIRRIQRSEVRGRLIDGRWYAALPEGRVAAGAA